MIDLAFLDKLFGSFSDKELKKIRPIADKVIALESEMAAKTDAELQAMTPALKERLGKRRDSGRYPARGLRRLP